MPLWLILFGQNSFQVAPRLDPTFPRRSTPAKALPLTFFLHMVFLRGQAGMSFFRGFASPLQHHRFVMLVQLCTLGWGSGGGGGGGRSGCAWLGGGAARSRRVCSGWGGGGGGRAPQTPEWLLRRKRGALFSPAHPENPGKIFS